MGRITLDDLIKDETVARRKNDIHDRVNHAAQKSFLRVDSPAKKISLEIEIDTTISKVMDYFEIFLTRMVMSRQAAEVLGCTFSLVIKTFNYYSFKEGF